LSAIEDKRFHGRRRGRRLRKKRQILLDKLLPTYELLLTSDLCELEVTNLFKKPVDEVWLEIGFGNGEHIIWQAKKNINIGLIGAEPFLNGVSCLLSYIENSGVKNIRILPEDVRPLLDKLPNCSLGRVFILFPDPWPKLRHHKRRLVSKVTLDKLADIMADGAELRLATDDADYAASILRLGISHDSFEWLAKRPDDWRLKPEDWPSTRYEKKNRSGGKGPIFLRFVRRERT
jgi:tRNA (guanine-N7-)-methyltransferase|tara:strand:+ start:474 stop:1172 length:699 start_codon:yes stop_codon:yes gene_type:complete